MIRRAKGDERDRFLADVKTNIARRGGAKTLVIARFAPDPSLEGKSLDELAQSREEDRLRKSPSICSCAAAPASSRST